MENKSSENKYFKLPTNVIPSFYDLTIIPDINNFKFKGIETVNVNVLEKTKKVILNSLDLDIESVKFISNDEEKSPSNIELDKNGQVMILDFENELNLGSGQFKFSFSGNINDKMRGFYRSQYKTPNNEIKFAAVTQFESTYARQAFPCWDQPDMKAKFLMKLIVPKDKVTLSNMNIVKEVEDETDKTKKVVTFDTTPLMSTYLLAYIVGEYEFLEQVNEKGVLVRVFTPIGKRDQGKFALEVAVRSLEFYEEYFKIAYPLPKLDLIAISDFETGAMENWGLLTYREVYLLHDPLKSSQISKKNVVKTICHEVAHQWFGNLVTFKEWNDLWLNGFANFMENYSSDKLYPDLKIWDNYVSSCFLKALSLDALHNSHPIEVPVNNPNDVEEIFDEISYEKSSCVIRMLFNYIGEEDFKNGIRSYLEKYSYKNATTENLWTSLEETTKKPISTMMSSWTKQKGFPIVKVDSKQDGNKRILTISQKKFCIDNVLNEQDQAALWIVPLSIISQNNPKPVKVLLDSKSTEVVLENVEPNEWINVNSGSVSYIRIDYSLDMIEKFYPSILDKSLSVGDRLCIQNNIYALVQNGSFKTDFLLKLIEYYINETEYTVWLSIISSLSKLNSLLSNTDFYEIYYLYVRKVLSNIYSKLGSKPVQGENYLNGLLRPMVFSFLITAKDPIAFNEAKLQFDAHIRNTKRLSLDFYYPVFKAIVSDCDDKTFEKFFQMYRDTSLQEEKMKIAQSIGFTKDPCRIQKVLDFALSNEVRIQDTDTVIACVASHKVGRDLAWQFLKDNHDEFIKRYSSGSILSSLIEDIASGFASEKELHEVSDFFSRVNFPSTERTVQQVLERIKSNSDWLNRDTNIIKNYLTNNV